MVMSTLPTIALAPLFRPDRSRLVMNGSTRTYRVGAFRKRPGVVRVDPKVQVGSIGATTPIRVDPNSLHPRFGMNSPWPDSTRTHCTNGSESLMLSRTYPSVGSTRTHCTRESDLIPTPTWRTHGSESIPTGSHPTPGRVVKWIVWPITSRDLSWKFCTYACPSWVLTAYEPFAVARG